MSDDLVTKARAEAFVCRSAGHIGKAQVIDKLADRIEALEATLIEVARWVSQGSLCDSDPPYERVLHVLGHEAGLPQALAESKRP